MIEPSTGNRLPVRWDRAVMPSRSFSFPGMDIPGASLVDPQDPLFPFLDQP